VNSHGPALVRARAAVRDQRLTMRKEPLGSTYVIEKGKPLATPVK